MGVVAKMKLTESVQLIFLLAGLAFAAFGFNDVAAGLLVGISFGIRLAHYLGKLDEKAALGLTEGASSKLHQR